MKTGKSNFLILMDGVPCRAKGTSALQHMAQVVAGTEMIHSFLGYGAPKRNSPKHYELHLKNKNITVKRILNNTAVFCKQKLYIIS